MFKVGHSMVKYINGWDVAKMKSNCEVYVKTLFWG